MPIKSLVIAFAAAATFGATAFANAAVCSGSVPDGYSPALSDVMIGEVAASSCAYYSGNDNGWSPGAGWTSIGKSDDENPITGDVDLDPTGTLWLSLLLTPDDAPAGELMLSWTGGPALMDFTFVLKSSTEYFAYTFEEFLLDPDEGGYEGTYRVAIANLNSKKGPKDRDLSHLTFWARGERVDAPGPNPVPAPGALALLGVGVLVASTIRRRSTC
ncbi:MAG TPA: hypothetical protein VGE10_14740 [Zeimonas sp.]